MERRKPQGPQPPFHQDGSPDPFESDSSSNSASQQGEDNYWPDFDYNGSDEEAQNVANATGEVGVNGGEQQEVGPNLVNAGGEAPLDNAGQQGVGQNLVNAGGEAPLNEVEQQGGGQNLVNAGGEGPLDNLEEPVVEEGGQDLDNTLENVATELDEG